ncbi:MAG TPA: hypothetical protein VES73_14405, partial [Lamprocystis sp. (in: g-proteobacteria)]|nr:hypothetical protein [Lamprocystis sp. (in: g-proteobacteria)]
MSEPEPMITERMRALLGARAGLIDTPLALRNSPRTGDGLSLVGNSHEVRLSAVEQAAIVRDAWCCRMCGFVSKADQRAVALNGNRRDIDQTVTACDFCHQCFHLEQVAAMGSGVLIWAPEVSQAELHHIAREVYVGRVIGGEAAETAKACLEAILARRAGVRERIGSDDPAVLSARIQASGGRLAAEDDLGGIRLFPLDRQLIRQGNRTINLFPPMLGHWVWREGPYANAGLGSLAWLDYGSAVFGAEEDKPAEAQQRNQNGVESRIGSQETTDNGDAQPEFIFRRYDGERFKYQILKLNRQSGEYD